MQKLETSLKEEILQAQKWLEVTLEQEKQMKMFKSCLTVQEIFNQHKSSHPGLVYKRIPLPDCSAPAEEVMMKTGTDTLQGGKKCLEVSGNYMAGAPSSGKVRH